MINFRILKFLSVFVFVFYFVSMIIGPVYGWKGEDNGVEYEITMHQWGRKESEYMKKESAYIVELICLRNNIPVNKLMISLPDGFSLISTKMNEIRWPKNNWKHIFEVKSPTKSGSYNLRFQGNDVEGNVVEFSAPVNVEQISAYDSMKKKTPDFLVYFGAIIGILMIVRLMGG